ncbi:MAG: hypothetical protein IKH14_00415 [Prevotella sp.]|nr:hypothetical protein [Prevotella sp.]
MSRIRQILELDSPSMKSLHECVVGIPQPCNYCGGSGWFWGEDGFGEAVKEDCPLCKGSGKLRPVVTIDWETVKTERL